jgi:hypothetical protein
MAPIIWDNFSISAPTNVVALCPFRTHTNVGMDSIFMATDSGLLSNTFALTNVHDVLCSGLRVRSIQDPVEESHAGHPGR